ncbi:MAG: IS66 family transposase zinc-finger binding domain-containing protein, partial [Acutalibacteraceae bacterium]|nr:IS66 family transposase zinc-finger binding domain-containing protein [Acutalibacteraceae bacterium]
MVTAVKNVKCNENSLHLDLFNEAETFQESITIELELETVVKAHSRKKSKRGSKFDNLPVEVIEHKLDESEMICDVCGEPLTVMKKETRRELVIIPAQAKIVEHVTYSYSCRNCDKNGESGFIKQAEHPKALIPKS